MTTKPFTISVAIFLVLFLAVTTARASIASSRVWDLQKGSPAAAPPLVWVRQDSPVINVNNDPTFYEAPEGDRFEGSFWEYIVDETAIIYEERFVDHEYEWYHITLRSELVRPPLVINPPLRYKLTAQASHSATKTEGAEGVGFQLWYNSNYADVDPHEVLGYYPWSPYFTGLATKTWMVSAPVPQQVGDTFELYASWWNCPPCNITWTYRAEPANEVEQLGVEVVAPMVEYQDEEIPPGETFYPGTCALPGEREALCGQAIDLVDAAEIRFNCASLANYDRLLMLLQMLDIFPEKQLDFYVHLARMKDRCGLPAARAGDDYQVSLVLNQGAFIIDNLAPGQTLSVHTGPGSATADHPGVFAASYLPENERAVFRAFSTPLDIQPSTGAPLVLQAGQQVELTPAGPGPVTWLPRVLLPVAIR